MRNPFHNPLALRRCPAAALALALILAALTAIALAASNALAQAACPSGFAPAGLSGICFKSQDIAAANLCEKNGWEAKPAAAAPTFTPAELNKHFFPNGEALAGGANANCDVGLFRVAVEVGSGVTTGKRLGNVCVNSGAARCVEFNANPAPGQKYILGGLATTHTLGDHMACSDLFEPCVGEGGLDNAKNPFTANCPAAAETAPVCAVPVQGGGG